MKRLSVLFLCFSAITDSTFAINTGKHLDLRGSKTENFSSMGLLLKLETEKGRFMGSEPIPVKLLLVNKGHYPISLYLDRDFRKNFTLIVRDKTGKSLPLIKPILNRDVSSKEDIYFYRNYTGNQYQVRRIILQPGENFTREVLLRDSVQIEEQSSGIENLQINAFFYPNPQQQNLFLTSENKLPIFVDYNLHPGSKPITAMTSLQKPLGLDAKEVIFLTLSAEITGDWDNFFKYMSLPDIIRDYPEYAREYIRSQPYDRPKILQLFKEYLRNEKDRKLIQFRIIHEDSKPTHMNLEGATVKARVFREMEGLKREFIYTFFLTRKGNLWQITGVQSELLG